MSAALMQKGENFAVSLRKAKKQQILNDKRGRLTRGIHGGQNQPREIDNSPIAIATREFVSSIKERAP
jgi:hypothetical protein